MIPRMSHLHPARPGSRREFCAGTGRSRIFCHGRENRSSWRRPIVLLCYRVSHTTTCIAISSRRSILAQRFIFPNQQIARSPEQLTEWLQQNEITILHLTPALGQLLLTADEKTLPSIRRVLFGGDVLTWREVARIRQLAPNAKIGSFYGATETQRAVGYFEIPDEIPVYETDANHAVPLGRGIKDVQLLLLNRTDNWRELANSVSFTCAVRIWLQDISVTKNELKRCL